MCTSTKTGTRLFCRIGLTVVGNPAAQVMTSSPGLSALARSIGEVSAVIASRLADEPELTSQRISARRGIRAKPLFEFVVETPGGEPEVERAVDQDAMSAGAIHLARNRHHRCARLERAAVRELGILGRQFQNPRAQRRGIGDVSGSLCSSCCSIVSARQNQPRIALAERRRSARG